MGLLRLRLIDWADPGMSVGVAGVSGPVAAVAESDKMFYECLANHRVPSTWIVQLQ